MAMDAQAPLLKKTNNTTVKTVLKLVKIECLGKIGFMNIDEIKKMNFEII
jgi:hypothetical protein